MSSLDLSINEKCELEHSVNTKPLSVEKTQKHIMKLMAKLFYQLNKGISKGLEVLTKEITDLIESLSKKYITNEMKLFKETS